MEHLLKIAAFKKNIWGKEGNKRGAILTVVIATSCGKQAQDTIFHSASGSLASLSPVVPTSAVLNQ